MKGETDEQAVRTIVCREVVPGPKKDRWHPLYTTSRAGPWEVLQTFRTRQHHEQGYRVGVHDESLNAVPCGHDKGSPDRKRPRFHRGPLQQAANLVPDRSLPTLTIPPKKPLGASTKRFPGPIAQRMRDHGPSRHLVGVGEITRRRLPNQGMRCCCLLN